MAAPMSQAVTDFVAGTSDDAAKEIAHEINKKSARFLDFIELLGESLTNENTVVRSRATALIGDVLALLPPSFLSNDQVKVVASFLQAKLADHHSVQPSALQTLSVLTNRCCPLPDGVPQEICHSIFREIQNQTLSQKDRRANYLIFQSIIGSSFKDIESMGGDFVIGFIQQIDAEKDPRNLMLVFNCAHFISSNLTLGPFAEEMFEVLGCYFPIDFTPPPSDAHGITKDELILSLRKCFAATAEFAPFCLPLLVEKMTSDLQSARLDAFQTYIECAPIYGRSNIQEFYGSILSTAKREILMGLSFDLVSVARDAITALFKVFAPVHNFNTDKDDLLSTTIVEFYQDISKYIDGSDSVKGCLAMSMCTAIAKSSPQALAILFPLALPAFRKQCEGQAEETAQSIFFKEINGILQFVKDFSTNLEVKESFSKVSQDILNLYEKAFRTCTKTLLCAEVAKGWTYLLTAEGLVDSDIRSKLINAFSQKAVSEQDKTNRQEILTSLKLCLKANPKESAQIVEQLLESLKDNKERKCVLESLKYAVVDAASFSKTCELIINQMSSPQHDSHIQTVLENIDGLVGLIESQEKASECISKLPQVALPLLKVSAFLSSQWKTEDESKYSDYLQSCREIFKLISHLLPQKEASALWNQIYEFMLEGRIPASGSNGETSELKPLQFKSPWQQTRLVSILEGFLIGVPFQVCAENSEVVFESAFSLANFSTDEFTHSSACHCVAVIMNKAGYGSQIHWLLEPITEQLKKRMEGNDPASEKRNSLYLWAWIAKALECRGHSAVAIFTSQLVSMLNDPVLGKEAALTLGLVVEDKDWIFASKYNANMTPLYKQRFFTINLKSLLAGYEKAQNKSDIKENHLIAFSHITSNLPLQVLKPHLSKLVPPLLLSLDHAVGTSRYHSLSTLSSAIANAPDAISPSIDSLIPKLLDIAKNDASMKPRIASLECLEQMVKLPVHCITPHQNKVVRELVKTLDDKKRLVRKQAVETRSAWILLEPCSK